METNNNQNPDNKAQQQPDQTPKSNWREFTKTMYPVYSSQLKMIGWQFDAVKNEGFLQVEFNRGALYQYWPVPKVLFDQFFAAGPNSKGQWFHDKIKQNPAISFEKQGDLKLFQ